MFEYNFRYAHMHIIDIRQLKKSFDIFFLKNLIEKCLCKLSCSKNIIENFFIDV